MYFTFKNFFHYRWIIILLVVVCPTGVAAEVKTTEYLTLELVSELDAVVPGSTQMLGIRMKPIPEWHVYWKYQGDSGTPPEFEWKLPEGISIGDALWPYPERIKIGHLMNYGYPKETLLLFPVKASSDLRAGEKLKFIADVSWLVCKEECVPGKARLQMSLPVKDTASITESAELFQRKKEKLPINTADFEVKAGEYAGEEIHLSLNVKKALQRLGFNIYFIPDSGGQIENVAPQRLTVEGESLNLVLKKSKSHPMPGKLSGLLISESGWTAGHTQALEFETPVRPAAAQAEGLAGTMSVLTAVLFAFLGGLILNLMPCVFPVLSIKILGFVKKASDKNQKTSLHGLAFSGGVLLSFWILAGLLIFLQSTGTKLGWGFQLQSPVFLLLMIVVLYLVALNLIGFYEVGAKLQNLAGRFAYQGYLDSFLSGVLASVLATPCTAPFMGTAIAFSLSSSSGVAFLVFTFMALGMALPYAVLSSSPRLLKYTPKPGVWMEHLKQFLSFPVLATIIWLIGVYSRQTDGAGTRILFSLLLITIALWIGKNFSRYSRLLAGCLFAFAIYASVPQSQGSTGPQLEWEKFSNKTLDQYVEAGEAVFIDFTAEWCLTCKLNKYVALDKPEATEAFRDKGVRMLRADWTSIDPEITDALKVYQRSGVPVNVLYYGGGKSDYYVFPAVLTPGIVLEQLDKIRLTKNGD